MLTSKEVLDRSGISRATLNNYIARGLLPRPVVKRPAGKGATSPRQLGYFPPEVLDTLLAIQKLKRDGLDMEQIAQQLGAHPQEYMPQIETDSGNVAQPQARSDQQTPMGEPPKAESSALTLTVEDLPHAAYMVNYNFEVTWFNTQARAGLPNVFENLPPRIGDRSIFNLLLKSDSQSLSPNALALVRLNLALAKERMTTAAMLEPCGGLSSERVRVFEALCEETAAVAAKLTAEVPIRLDMNSPAGAQTRGGGGAGEGARDHVAYATYFREGILIVLAPYDGDAAELRRLLSRRDIVIRSLLSKRLPVLTELAVLVADLQESVKICSELPPHEYFELINEIWSVAGAIFRRYYGTHGKHVGDGMVYYFFPQPDSNYILNAAICAQELKRPSRGSRRNGSSRKTGPMSSI